jgi:hypothetical protein
MRVRTMEKDWHINKAEKDMDSMLELGRPWTPSNPS